MVTIEAFYLNVGFIIMCQALIMGKIGFSKGVLTCVWIVAAFAYFVGVSHFVQSLINTGALT